MSASLRIESPIKGLIRQLQRCEEEQLPPDFLEMLASVATKAEKEIFNKAGEFLHQLDDTKHTQDQVNTIIDLFPSALSHLDSNGLLPVQRAICCDHDNAVTFVPTLARRGERFGVGGFGNRGGLLTVVPVAVLPENWNVLQCLANYTGSHMDRNIFDDKRVRDIERLREMNLLFKEDIKKYNLLILASLPSSQQRFQYFAEWYPEELKTAKWKDGNPLIHFAINESRDSRDFFELVLKVGMKHSPNQHLGFLFQKHRGKTACEVAFDKFGAEEAMFAIRNCISPWDNKPILHHVAKHAPMCMNEFCRYYPDATYLRDANNRTLFHAELSSGVKSFFTDALFFTRATQEQISEKDPVTGLYPFMLAASGNTSDLSAVFRLLIRYPKLVLGDSSG